MMGLPPDVQGHQHVCQVTHVGKGQGFIDSDLANLFSKRVSIMITFDLNP